MKTKDLRQKNRVELEKMLKDLHAQLLEQRMSRVQSQMPKTHIVKQLKHDIAVVSTIINEKELERVEG